MAERVVTWAKEYREALWVSGAFAFAGLILVFVTTPHQENPWRNLALHAGLALLIAAVVGVLALLHEFRGVFLKNLEEILTEQRFFERLDPNTLKDIGEKAFTASIRHVVQNPSHEWRQMYQAVSAEVLPLVQQEHRIGYEESVSMEFLSTAEAADRLSVLHIPELTHDVCYVETTTMFRMVSPTVARSTPSVYSYDEEIELIPGIPFERHATGTIQLDGNPAQEIALTFTSSGNLLKVHGEIPFEYTGSCAVRLVTKIWEAHVPFILLTMRHLTRDLVVTVSSNRQHQFRPFVFTLGGRTDEPVAHPRMLRLRHTGWLLPDHGILVYWV